MRMGPVLAFDTGDARRGAGQLPQYFAKFFSRRCHITLCDSGDADGRRCNRAREWAVEQGLASHTAVPGLVYFGPRVGT